MNERKRRFHGRKSFVLGAVIKVKFGKLLQEIYPGEKYTLTINGSRE